MNHDTENHNDETQTADNNTGTQTADTAATAAPEPKPVNQKAVRLSYGEDKWQFGDLYLPEGPGPHPVAVVIHGGYWYAQYGLDLMDKMSLDFQARGIAAWNIEYRRIGHEGGAYPGTLTDVGLAADYLREIAGEYDLDLANAVTIGHSAGGHLALWAAGRHRLAEDSELRTLGEPLAIKGVVALAAASDLNMAYEYRPQAVLDLLGSEPSQCQERVAQASPAHLLPLGVPQVLIHGADDPVVPLRASTAYLEKARKLGDEVQLVELPGVEHFKVIDPDSEEAWPSIVQAMLELTGLADSEK